MDLIYWNYKFGYVDSTCIFLKSKSDGRWSDLRICKTKKDEKKKQSSDGNIIRIKMSEKQK